jgi:hypothetical protein
MLAASFMLLSCVAYSLTLKIEAACSPQTSVDFQWNIQYYSQKIDLFITTDART